jgi:hypothetical protein
MSEPTGTSAGAQAGTAPVQARNPAGVARPILLEA